MCIPTIIPPVRLTQPQPGPQPFFHFATVKAFICVAITRLLSFVAHPPCDLIMASLHLNGNLLIDLSGSLKICLSGNGSTDKQTGDVSDDSPPGFREVMQEVGRTWNTNFDQLVRRVAELEKNQGKCKCHRVKKHFLKDK